MVVWLFSFYLLSTAQAKNCDDGELSTTRSLADIYKVFIEKWVAVYDLKEIIGKYEEIIAGCDQLKFEMAISPAKKESWLRMGQVSNIKRLKKEIEYLSQIRDVEPELKDYKDLLKSAKIHSASNQYFHDVHLKRGKKSQVQTENKCTSVDLSKGFGEPRDQGTDLHWCFSPAAADLLSFKTGKRLSAIDMAAKYYSENPGVDKDLNWLPKSSKVPNPNYPYMGVQTNEFALYEMSYASAKKTLEVALKSGVCLQKDVGAPDGESFAIEDFKRLEKLQEAAKESSCDNLKMMTSNPANDFLVQKFFPQKNLSDLIAVFRSSEKSNLFETLISRSCTPFMPDKNFQVVHKEVDDVDLDRDLNKRLELAEHVDRELEKGNPTMIFYHYRVLEKKFIHPVDADHYSNIVGRRFNKQKERCEYLLRNTKGKDCSFVDTDFECNDGQIWLPKDILAAGIEQTINITP